LNDSVGKSASQNRLRKNHHHHPRKSDATRDSSVINYNDMCSINRSFNTTYNDNLAVPPYRGIMFEVTALGVDPLTVLTLELDLRLENATAAELENLKVQVYTASGHFHDALEQAASWHLVADATVAVNSNTNNAIIPVQQFHPVRIPGQQLQSFYVTTNGSYLDFTVDALQKTGEVQVRGDDLQLFVGAGLTSGFQFPAVLDKVLHPMFAGVLHYEIEHSSGNCNDRIIKTVLDVPFLFETSVANMADVTMAIDDAVAHLLGNDPHLRSLGSEFGLQQPQGAETKAVKYTREYCSH